MRCAALVLAVALVAIFAETAFCTETTRSPAALVSLFAKYVARFRKAYQSTLFTAKFKVFQTNVEAIDAKNKAPAIAGRCKFGITRFTDLAPAEFAKRFLTATDDQETVKPASFLEARALSQVEEAELLATLPEGFDWRQNMAFDPLGLPKDQGDCGSCWAFGSVAAVESSFAIAAKRNVQPLSEQALLDCAGIPNFGCSGGRVVSALRHMAREKNGVFLLSAYPYVAKKGGCAASKLSKYGYVGNVTALAKSDAALMAAIHATGPIAVSLNANALQSYESGVIPASECPPNKGANHVVSVVGWGSQPDDSRAKGKIDYWIIRNSWAADWGEEAGFHHPGKLGYYRLERDGTNLCKIHNNAYSVTTVKV